MALHEITKMRHEVRRRKLTVDTVENLTPGMRRISFTSPELGGFASPSPDDHIKIFLPASTPGGDPVMRDFTPRAFDSEAGTLVLDFALHQSGPATEWAASAAVGDMLEIGGPRGSTVVPDDFDWYLLIGDETALPSFGRRVEGLRARVPVTTIVAISCAAEQQTFSTEAAWTGTWIVREENTTDDTEALQRALADHPLPPGDGFIWVAAESSVSRALYSTLVDERGHSKNWIKASGYWSREGSV